MGEYGGRETLVKARGSRQGPVFWVVQGLAGETIISG
jgi:hypothetical protein